MKPLAKRPPPAPLYVLGEGDDEKHFFEQLCRAHRIEGVHCLQYDGRDALRGYLESLHSMLDPAVGALLIVQDADDSAAAAFMRVRDALDAAGFVAPATPGALAAGAPATSVLILPGDGQVGTLETLCWQALAQDPERECVEQFLDCIADRGQRPIAAVHKAPIRAWLATRERAETRVGLAARLGSLPLEATAFRPLLDFLREARRRAG